MKIGEKQQIEGGEFSKTLYTGFGLFKVVLLNPTREQLCKLRGVEYKETNNKGEELKEYEYEGTDSTGKEYVEVVAYLQHVVNPEIIIPHKMRFYDEEASWTKDNITKYSYVNQLGNWAAVDDEKNLLQTFTHLGKRDKDNKGKLLEVYGELEYRIAIRGEVEFYGFIQAWIDSIAEFYREGAMETNILIDKKKMFRNVNKYVKDELQPLIEKGNPINGLAIVNIREKDGKVNHYQGMYGSFWPEWKFKSMVNAINTGNWNTDTLQKEKARIEKGTSKAAVSFGWIKPFSESEHINATNDVFQQSEGAEITSTDY